MYITNRDELIPALRTRLEDYLLSKELLEPGQKKLNCIFHAENTPSMVLNPKTQYETAHCFSCGANIDIFAAAHQIDGLPATGPEWMTETVPALASLLGIPIKMGAPSPREKERLRLFRLAQDIADIIEAPDAVNTDYMEKRNWTNDFLTCGTVAEHDLINLLYDKGWSNADLNTSLMVRTTKTSFFGSNKATFTVRDFRGRPIGFISRNLGDEGPKYINTIENDIFEKRKALLGLDIALREAKTNGLYIVEGPGDLAQLNRLGIKNAVAVSGTAFTSDHMTLLKMLGVRRLYFCLDWDRAGATATSKIFAEALRNAVGMGCWVVLPPEDMAEDTDPDSYLFKSNDENDFRSLPMCSAFEWVMRESSDNDAPELICERMVPIIAVETTAVRRELLIKQLQEFSGISFSAIASDVSHIRDRKHEEKRARLLAATQKYADEVQRDPDNLYAVMAQHESDIRNIEKDYKRDLIGVDYQMARYDSIQQMKEKDESGIDRSTFKMEYFTDFANALSGGMIYTTGTVIYFGGRANSGKTACVTAIGMDVAMSDPDTIVVMHYTDDSYTLIEPRLKCIISMMQNKNQGSRREKLTIGMAAAPYVNIKTDHQWDLYNRADAGIRDLISTEKLIIIDSEDGATLSALERILRYVRQRHPKKKVLTICDNTYNYMDFMHLDQTAKITQIANAQKNMAIKYHTCMIATAEYRKNMPLDKTKIKLPVNDDLADARAMMYRSNAIVHVYNDLKDRADAAEIFHTNPDYPGEALPRLMLIFGKNKITAFNKNLTVDLDPDTVTIKPIRTDEAGRQYEAYSKSDKTMLQNGKLIIQATDWQAELDNDEYAN